MLSCNRITLILFTACLFGVSGCTARSIQVAQVDPVEHIIDTVTLDVRNCDRLEALNEPLSARAQIKHSLTVDQAGTCDPAGESIPLPPETLNALEAEIEQVYQQAWDQANTIIAAEMLSVPANKIKMYRMQWKRLTYAGSVSFTLDRNPCTAGYTYTIDIPEIQESWEMACTA